MAKVRDLDVYVSRIDILTSIDRTFIDRKMAKLSTILLSSAVVAFLQFAPKDTQQPLIDLLARIPHLSASTILQIAKYIAGFTAATGAISKINTYLSRGVSNNWTEDKYDWNKEVLLLTGASSGLGEQMAQMFADRGVKVIALDVQPIPPSMQSYKNIHFYNCDVTDYTRLPALAAKIRKEHGDPTVLVLNAGIVNAEPLLKIPLARTQKLLDINLTSHFAMLHEFLPSMVAANHGHVVQIASMCSYLSICGLSDYCASKAGVLALHETLRAELRHLYKADKVRTSIVHPTWMRTNILAFEGWVKERKLPFAPLEKCAQQVVEAVMGGYSARVLVPDKLGMQLGMGVRA
ncbi:Dehydrogenase RED2 [Drechslerella dactyloides]|uniref:Dehydrogenase RED2 n=1 Tax=Drechslerella dactyloides TaxID=74499 RepID=A0AAD6NGH6_DREDA|nr:Dehydrogenase RED2 [Drechslerella dactyloides]